MFYFVFYLRQKNDFKSRKSFSTHHSRIKNSKSKQNPQGSCRVPLMTVMLSYWYFIYDVKSVVTFQKQFFLTPCLQHSFPLSSHLITSTVYIYKHACTLKKKAKQHRKVKIELTGLSRVQFQNLYRVFMRLHVFISHTFYSKFMCK